MRNKLKLPVNKIAGNIVKPIETSYEIICAAERKAPKKAYLELLAQPPKIMPYTFKEDIAKINKIP